MSKKFTMRCNQVIIDRFYADHRSLLDRAATHVALLVIFYRQLRAEGFSHDQIVDEVRR